MNKQKKIEVPKFSFELNGYNKCEIDDYIEKLIKKINNLQYEVDYISETLKKYIDDFNNYKSTIDEKIIAEKMKEKN
ncbi:UNVERIFIED_CONTAM: hypothetical protein O8I53_05485 [Campylobacter lari]